MKLKLETRRLTLKPVAKNDLQMLHKIFTDESVRKYLFDDEILPVEQVEDFISISEKSFAEKNYGLWLICLNETQETIGLAGLWTFFDEPQPQLLYALLTDFTGQSFATEASEKIIGYCFSNLSFDYLIASCDAPNIDSHRVAERLGMKKFKEEIKNGLPTVFFKLENR